MSEKAFEIGGSMRDPSWKGTRRKMFIPLFMAAMMLLLFFLADMSYLFGSVYEQRTRIHALETLVVDFDGGVIGTALEDTYQSLKGNSFPTLKFQDPSSKYPDESSMRDAVCTGGYWAAVYVHRGASSRLASAVAGDSSALPYEPNDTVTYIYNQARYTTTSLSAIEANLQTLISSSAGSYYSTDAGRQALANLNSSDPAAVQAFLRPIEATSDIITPTPQGARNFYNTLNVVFPIILTFFFVLTLNGISGSFNVWARLRPTEIWLLRFVSGKLYTLAAALVITAYVWAFRENWAVSDSVFATGWMIIWFQMDINWQIFDAVLDGFIPIQFSPLFMLTWIIFNVTSAVMPFEIAPGFYRIGYGFPGYNIYSLQVRAWSGCTRQLHINLPILFAWWLVGHVAVVFSILKRSRDARRAAKEADPQASDQSQK